MLIAGMTFYQICWYFFLYSVIGWMIEVIFHAVVLGKVINRGFLNGPVCPVYGFGMLLVLAVINLVTAKSVDIVSSANVWVIFLCSMVLASAVEFLAGWLLLHCFHARWWDYSEKPFNLGGYICAEFSILWGLGGVLVVRVFHPMIDRSFSGWIPPRIGWPILAFVYLTYIADAIVTSLIVIGLNKKLAELDRIRSGMRVVSDAMSERIGETTIATSQLVGETQVQASLAKAELRDRVAETRLNALSRMDQATAKASSARAHAAAKAQDLKDAASDRANVMHENAAAKAAAIRAALLKPVVFGPARLLRAFPQLRHLQYNELMEELRRALPKR